MREENLEKNKTSLREPEIEESSALAPEEASLALSQITQIIEREEESKPKLPPDPKHPLAKPLSQGSKDALRAILAQLHPADVAYVL